jgi:hypothetical protein
MQLGMQERLRRRKQTDSRLRSEQPFQAGTDEQGLRSQRYVGSLGPRSLGYVDEKKRRCPDPSILAGGALPLTLAAVSIVMICVQISYRNFSTGPTIQAVPFPLPLIIILAPVPHLGLILPLPPIHPTASIIPHVPITRLLGLLTGRSAPLSRSAVKDHLLLGQGFVEHVFLDE